MLNTLNGFVYTAFGLKIQSEIKLPEAVRENWLVDDEVDVEIVNGDIVMMSEEWSEVNQYFFLNGNKVLFHVPDVAFFLIKNGKKIIVSPEPNANEDQLRLYLLGTCMGVILLQRKILPLHGSVIAIDGKAYAIVGDSGAGKSTLASAFINQGYKLLTDDVIPVYFNEENIPMVTPSYPQQKLWQESLDQFGMSSDNYRPLFARETKFSVPIESKFHSEPLPLAGVFELIKSRNDSIEIQAVEGLHRIYTLFYHTYRNFLIEPMGLMDWHFQMSTRIINYIDLYQLRRPIARFTANDLPSLILEKIRNN